KKGIQVLFSEKSQHELTADDRAALGELHSGGSTLAVVALCVLVGVVVGGILAAIAVPNLLTAMQRAKQKRTIADMVQFAGSMNAYAEANHRLPSGRTITEVGSEIHSNVRVDGWGHDLRYVSDGQTYWLVSAGKDGQFEHERPEEYKPGEAKGFDADIVIHNS